MARRRRLLARPARLAWRLGLLGGLLGLAGCSGEESFLLPPPDAGLPATPYAAACAGWAQRECAYESGCGVSINWQWEDNAQCVQRRTITCELEANDPDVSFDPARVDGCQFPAACADVYGTAGEPESPYLCLAPGHAANGDPCVWNDDCQSEQCWYSYLATGVMSSCGKCQPLVKCDCDAGQECVYDLNDGGVACLTLPELGEACSADTSCAEGACVPSGADDGSGTCTTVPFAGFGEPCGVSAVGPLCVGPGAFCNTTTLLCDTFQTASYGQPCAGPDAPGPGAICTGGATCDTEITGNCIPPAPDGALCDYAQGLYCLAPAECIGSTCVFPTHATCAP